LSEPQKELQDLGWCIVEIMGHRKFGAKVQEAALFGVVLLRAEIPVQVEDGQPEQWMTQLYGGSSIFCLTPATEEVARAVAYRFTQPPVSRYELPPATVARPIVEREDYDPDPEPEDDGEPDFAGGEEDDF
jgi:hypothetical protein